MRLSKKKLIIYVCGALTILSGVISWGFCTYMDIVRQREMEAEMEERQLEIIETYIRLNVAFGVGPAPDEFSNPAVLNLSGQFRPLSEIPFERNRFGIGTVRYLILRKYYHRTGALLAYETMVEYFSQEFEPCGALRLYNNGKHPEIEAFVNWSWEEPNRRYEDRDYRHSLHVIYMRYSSAHVDAGFVRQDFTALSPQMLDALARAEADPDYILDLTSLQQQGY